MSVFYIEVVLMAVTSQTKSVSLFHRVLKEAPLPHLAIPFHAGQEFWEYLEVPGEEVYNIVVLKEKSIFQDGRPHCAHLIRKWTRGLQKTI